MASVASIPSSTSGQSFGLPGLDLLINLVVGIRVELTVFLAAVAIHYILFGKYRLGQASKGGKTRKCAAYNVNGSSSKEGALADAVTRSVLHLVASKAGSEKIATAICEQLKGCDDSAVSSALTQALKAVGKGANAELLTAVGVVLRRRSVDFTASLGECVLQGYLSLHRMDEFYNLLDDLENTTAQTDGEHAAGFGLLAMKAALHTSNWDRARARFSSLQEMWQKETSSSAPRGILQQLVQLAASKGQINSLIQDLQKVMLPIDTLDFVLNECVLVGDDSICRQVQQLGHSLHVPFSSRTCATLIQRLGTLEDVERLSRDMDHGDVASAEVVVAILQVAAAHRDDKSSAALVESLLKKLPTGCTQPSVAVAMLRFYAGLPLDLPKFSTCNGRTTVASAPNAGASASPPEVPMKTCIAILDLYETYFAGVDLSADSEVEWLVVDAALRAGTPPLLAQVLPNKQTSRQMALIKRLGSMSRLKDAQAVFHACPEKPSGIYNALLEACVNCCNAEAAESVMQEAVRAGNADVATYNTLMKVHLNVGNLQRAKSVMAAMRSGGIVPNQISYNELLDAALAHSPDSIWALLDEMSASGLKPNNITCSILLKGMKPNSKAAHVEQTIKVLDSMEELDEVLLGSVVEACIRIQRADLLWPRLRRQQSAKKVLVQGAHTYGSLIRGFGYVQDLHGVWETWREMRTRHIAPTSVTLGCMIEAVVSNGDPDAGLELIHDIQATESKHVVNAVIYCSVLKGFSHQRKFDRVWSVYQEMLSLDINFSIIQYNTLIDACARCSAMERVQVLLEDMARQRIEPNLISYSAILKGYCREKKLDMAFQVMETVKHNTPFTPDEVMFNSLLDGCAFHGNYNRGLAVLKEMEQVGVSPSNFTLSVLVKLACRANQLEAAFDLSNQIAHKYSFRLNVHVYNNLIHGCICQKNAARAMGVLTTMLKEKVKPDARTYKLLIQADLAAGQYSSAIGILRAALGLPKVHPSLMSFSQALLQPQGGLPKAILSDSMESICRGNEREAVSLMQDIRQQLPGFCLAPAQLHLAMGGHK